MSEAEFFFCNHVQVDINANFHVLSTPANQIKKKYWTTTETENAKFAFLIG